MGHVRRGKGAVVEAAGRFRGRPAIEARYQHFRLERQAALLAPNTLGTAGRRRRRIRGHLHEVVDQINAERERLGLAQVEADSAEATNLAARQTRAAKLARAATVDLRAGWRAEAAGALASTLTDQGGRSAWCVRPPRSRRTGGRRREFSRGRPGAGRSAG